MTELDDRLAELLEARKQMTLVEFIEDVEKRHFRTGHDTGSNPNALMIWNMVREVAGLERLTQDDLIRRHAESTGRTFEDMKEDYRKLDEYKRERGSRL